MVNLKKNKFKNVKATAGSDLSFLFHDSRKGLSNNRNDIDKIFLSRERVHLAKFLFIFVFAIFIARSTSLAIFPGEILSKPNKIISNSNTIISKYNDIQIT